MTMRVHTIVSFNELRALGPRWDAMVLASGDAGLFYQLGWLERAWPYYQARLGGQLSFLVAEHEGELLGAAPLVLITRGWAKARQRVLGFIGGTWDELDNWMPGFLLAAPDAAGRTRVMTAFAEAIERSSWDLLDLRFIRSECPSHEVLRSRFSTLRATRDRLTTPRARLDAGWADYWAGRDKRLLRMLDRGHKRAAQDGVALVYEVTAGVPVERRAETEAIHRARQAQIRATGRPRSSPFEDRGARQLFWALIDWAASRGHIRAHWLRLGDRTAAYIITLHHAGTTFAYFDAIDQAAERYHPGSVILAKMIECEATRHGAVVIDMMIGANLTKTLLATEELVNTHLEVVNPRQLRSRVGDAWIRAVRAASRRLRHG